MPIGDDKIEQEILRQVAAARSVAPRDVAMAVTPEGQDWRSFLSRIREISVRLHGEGRLVLVRKRKSIAPSALKGVYRLAAPENFEAETLRPQEPNRV